MWYGLSGASGPTQPNFSHEKMGACPRLLVRYPEGGANRQKRPVPSVFALNSDRPRHPAKLPVKPSQTFSAKRRSVAVQHCAFWGVLGGLWLGGKFSHAKSAIEHKRRYVHRLLRAVLAILSCRHAACLGVVLCKHCSLWGRYECYVCPFAG